MQKDPSSASISSDTDEGSSESNSEDERSRQAFHKQHKGKNGERDDDVQVTQSYEFLSRQEFLDFLYDKTDKATDGILQKFVSPKEEQKSTLTIIWSNKLCFFEKRAINYDGEKYHSQILPIRGATLPHRMQSIANSVRYHISNITFEKMHISRMVLHFRLDQKDRLWLLYCSSLRLVNDDEVGINSLTETKIHKPNLNGDTEILYDKDKMNAIPLQLNSTTDPETRIFKPNHSHSQKLEKFDYERCYNCLEESDRSQFYQISYKLLLQSHMELLKNKKEVAKIKFSDEKILLMSKLLDNAKLHGVNRRKTVKVHNVENPNLPFIIKYLLPNHKDKLCEDLLEDSEICGKQTYVCENCYLEHTEFMLKQEHIFGNESLEQTLSPNKKKKFVQRRPLRTNKSSDFSRSPDIDPKNLTKDTKPPLAGKKKLPTLINLKSKTQPKPLPPKSKPKNTKVKPKKMFKRTKQSSPSPVKQTRSSQLSLSISSSPKAKDEFGRNMVPEVRGSKGVINDGLNFGQFSARHSRQRLGEEVRGRGNMSFNGNTRGKLLLPSIERDVKEDEIKGKRNARSLSKNKKEEGKVKATDSVFNPKLPRRSLQPLIQEPIPRPFISKNVKIYKLKSKKGKGKTPLVHKAQFANKNYNKAVNIYRPI